MRRRSSAADAGIRDQRFQHVQSRRPPPAASGWATRARRDLCEGLLGCRRRAVRPWMRRYGVELVDARPRDGRMLLGRSRAQPGSVQLVRGSARRGGAHGPGCCVDQPITSSLRGYRMPGRAVHATRALRRLAAIPGRIPMRRVAGIAACDRAHRARRRPCSTRAPTVVPSRRAAWRTACSNGSAISMVVFIGGEGQYGYRRMVAHIVLDGSAGSPFATLTPTLSRQGARGWPEAGCRFSSLNSSGSIPWRDSSL